MGTRRKKLLGRVERIIKPSHPAEPEKAQIEIEGADDLYKEIRVENVVTDDKGQKSAFNEGEYVDVVVEADSKDKEHTSGRKSAAKN